MAKIDIKFDIIKNHELYELKKSIFEDLFTGSSNSLPISSLGKFSKEIFYVDKEIETVNFDDMFISKNNEYSFLRITHSEEKYQNLENATYQSFKKIFKYMFENKDLNFLRAWNYIPDILKVDNLERYREFNVGRWNAWQEFGLKFEDGTPMRPAMTGIGSIQGPLIIEALFTKYPVVYLENPKQKQFIDYSKKWGTKPPISARGTLHLHPEGSEIFIAGTASLLGEEVAYEVDIVKQTKETLKNIEVLISKENLLNYKQEQGFELNDLDGIRVYIKNPDTDLGIVAEIIEEYFPGKEILYLHNDICRPGFLIEIEAIARKK